MIHIITDTTTDPIRAGTNPVIVNPVTTNDANQKNNPFKIIPNKPRVNILTGRVRIEITGLINVLTRPSTKATNNAVTNVATEIPGTKYEVARTASVSASHFKRIFTISVFMIVLIIHLLIFLHRHHLLYLVIPSSPYLQSFPPLHYLHLFLQFLQG